MNQAFENRSNTLHLHSLKKKIENAATEVKKILDRTRNPVFPTEQSHAYNDKYLLAEIVVNAGIVSFVNALSIATGGVFGGGEQGSLKSMVSWAEDSEVTLRFSRNVTCNFQRTTTEDVESPNKTVVESEGLFGSSKKTYKNVTTVTWHHWKVTCSEKLIAYKGIEGDDGNAITLFEWEGSHELKTTGAHGESPRVPGQLPSKHSKELSITWLLRNLRKEDEAEIKSTSGHANCMPGLIHNFFVIRDDECFTPVRNQQTKSAFEFFTRAKVFCSAFAMSTRVCWKVSRSESSTGVSSGSIFSAVQAVFCLENRSPAATAAAATPGKDSGSSTEAVVVVVDEQSGLTLSLQDFNVFLNYHFSDLNRKASELTSTVGAIHQPGLMSSDNARCEFGMTNASTLCSEVIETVMGVEMMLRTQLIDAIGKIVQPSDFAEYMDFHNRSLFKQEHIPKGFCYAVRRDSCFPEGILSVNVTKPGSDGGITPIMTSVMRDPAPTPMRFPISAAADVVFAGDRYVHTCVVHEFSSSKGTADLHISARARQFSSFILLVGKIASAEVFEPSAALIVQNLDDLKIPLLLETIPTPKEFADAIESLSPEQQRFAKAFRSMQLSSTMFGMCVILIKPQLERVLNLPEGALTKEIALTQDLMKLFVEYQIPSDLLSFEDVLDSGTNESSAKAEAVAKVKAHVQAIQDIIAKSKAEEIERAKQEREKARYTTGVDSVSMELQAASATFGSARGGGGGGGGFRSKGKRAARKSRASPAAPMASMMRMEMSAAPPVFAKSMAPAPAPAPAGLNKLSQQQKPAQQEQPRQHQQHQQQQSQAQEQSDGRSSEEADKTDTPKSVGDYTKLPFLLDEAYKTLDVDSALRPTIIKMRENWTKRYQEGLLSKPVTKTLAKTDQKNEKNSAYDLLDALSRSGSLSIDHASLHIVIAATHCFDKTILETVIQDNVNPVEKVERSSLIMASTVKQVPVANLVKPSELSRIRQYSPSLFT